MRKTIVRQLRQTRREAETRERNTGKVLATKFPEVKAYLDAGLEAERASAEFMSAWTDLTQTQREELIPEFAPIIRVHLRAPARRRDMTETEFRAALTRRGFEFQERAIQISIRCFVGHVMRWNSTDNEYRIDRRATLARAIEGIRKSYLDVSTYTV